MKLSVFLFVLSVGVVFSLPDQKQLDSAQLAKTKEIFNARCVRCHGVDGKGQTELGARLHVPDFTVDAWPEAGVTDADLASTIRTGRDEMPAFGKKLSHDEIHHLIIYIHTLSQNRSQ
jgi:cytochrome c oxidase cbb3-type subunit III